MTRLVMHARAATGGKSIAASAAPTTSIEALWERRKLQCSFDVERT
jgi:hypothetical protein